MDKTEESEAKKVVLHNVTAIEEDVRFIDEGQRNPLDSQDSPDNATPDGVYVQEIGSLTPSDQNKSEDSKTNNASRIMTPLEKSSKSPVVSPPTATAQPITNDVSPLCCEDLLVETAVAESIEALANSAKNYLKDLAPKVLRDLLAPLHENSPSPISLSPTYSMVSFYPFYGNNPEVFPFTHILDLDDCSEEVSSSQPNPGSCIPPPIPEPCPQIHKGEHTKPQHLIQIQVKPEPIESPIPEKQDPIELPTPEEQDPIELPIPEEQEPIESQNPEEQEPIEYTDSDIEYHYSSLHEFPEWDDKNVNSQNKTMQFHVELTQNMLPVILPLKFEKSDSSDQNQSSILASLNIQNPKIDTKILQEGSFDSFTQKSAEPNFMNGISGFKELVEGRSKTKINSDEQIDFIDYFTRKDGYVYIGILEKFFNTYNEKTKEAIRVKESMDHGFKEKCELARTKISQIYQIVQLIEEKELQEYDFPAALERDIKIFQIDYMPKVTLIAKLHNYGVQMILHYVKLLMMTKSIDPTNVYTFSTELIADILVLSYGIFSKICDFLTMLNQTPSAEQLNIFTLDYLIQAFRNLVDCICDEIGAIGQSCGQILIRIPNLKEHQVIEVLTNIYKQVHYAFISIARAMESLAPALHLYYVKNFA